MIVSAGVKMICDGGGCSQVIRAKNRQEALRIGRSDGWTFQMRGPNKHYCLKHTIAKTCKLCGRFIVPQGRPRSQFPKRWVATGNKADVCRGCEESERKGTLHIWTKKIEEAGAQYLAMVPALAEFVEREDEQVRYDLARRLLDRCGAQDVARMVLG